MPVKGFFNFFFNYLATGASGPDTSAAVLIEVKSSSARDFNSLTIDAVVKDVAYRRIGMSEESIAPRAFLRRLWWLCDKQNK